MLRPSEDWGKSAIGYCASALLFVTGAGLAIAVAPGYEMFAGIFISSLAPFAYALTNYKFTSVELKR